jgi:hypothetical protein
LFSRASFIPWYLLRWVEMITIIPEPAINASHLFRPRPLICDFIAVRDRNSPTLLKELRII